jgi:hypothetical protein
VKARTARDLNIIAASCGADGWTLIRECKHLVVDFRFGEHRVRQIMSATASDRRACRNVGSEIRKAMRGGSHKGLPDPPRRISRQLRRQAADRPTV